MLTKLNTPNAFTIGMQMASALVPEVGQHNQPIVHDQHEHINMISMHDVSTLSSDVGRNNQPVVYHQDVAFGVETLTLERRPEQRACCSYQQLPPLQTHASPVSTLTTGMVCDGYGVPLSGVRKHNAMQSHWWWS